MLEYLFGEYHRELIEAAGGRSPKAAPAPRTLRLAKPIARAVAPSVQGAMSALAEHKTNPVPFDDIIKAAA
ncbi:MAG: hypothetical protein FJ318_09215 [SAR202 cluster bacterium]|nr:hypothetical protein [SAR202 cluster bacterium]